MKPTITVTVSPTGETQITTTGFTGATCRTATQALEAALGQRQSEQLTSEFYVANSALAPVQLPNGP